MKAKRLWCKIVKYIFRLIFKRSTTLIIKNLNEKWFSSFISTKSSTRLIQHMYFWGYEIIGYLNVTFFKFWLISLHLLTVLIKSIFIKTESKRTYLTSVRHQGRPKHMSLTGKLDRNILHASTKLNPAWIIQ